MQNAYGQTPLALAILKNHKEMVSRLLEIAAIQFTMKPENNGKQDAPRGLETGFVNNYAIEVMLEEHNNDDQEDVSICDETAILEFVII